MGNFLYRTLMCRRDVRILSIGLDAAGKTTILYQLKLGEVVTTIPTIGFNVETIQHGRVNVTCWDVGLREKSRPLLKHYLKGTDGLVFVVDSQDRERFPEALNDLLANVAEEYELVDIPVVVLANKQDLENVMTPQEIMEAIEKTGYLRNHPWKVFGTSGLKRDGLYESLDWLTTAIVHGQKEKIANHLGCSNAEREVETNVTEVNRTKTVQSNQSYFTNMVEYLKSFVVTK